MLANTTAFAFLAVGLYSVVLTEVGRAAFLADVLDLPVLAYRASTTVLADRFALTVLAIGGTATATVLAVVLKPVMHTEGGWGALSAGGPPSAMLTE